MQIVHIRETLRIGQGFCRVCKYEVLHGHGQAQAISHSNLEGKKTPPPETSTKNVKLNWSSYHAEFQNCT